MGIAGGLFFVWLLLYRLIVFGVAFFLWGRGAWGWGQAGERGGVYFTFYDFFQISSR